MARCGCGSTLGSGFGVLVQSSTGVAVTGPIELDYTTGAYYQGSVIGTNVTDGTCGAMVLAFPTHCHTTMI